MLGDPACEHPSLRPPGVSYTTTTDQNNSSKDPGGGGQAQPRLGLPQGGEEPAADSEVTQATNSNRSRPSGAKWTQEQQAVLQQQRPSGRGHKRQRGDMADGANTTSPSANQGPQELQNRLAAVSERTLQYEMALKEKDNELARLKQMLAMKGEQLPGPSTQAGPASVITEQELKQAYCSSVQALKDYLLISNLTSYDITGKNLPEKVTADIKALVHTISKVCLQILKPETPYVLETISKDYSSTTAADWELDKSHWINVISQLQLSNLQVLSILNARDLHLQKMQALLNERAILARQAADLTAATCSTNPVMSDDVSNVAVLMQHGYLYFARNALLLQRVVDMFKESLLREQKTVMELFLKVLYQVLSPVQAALFVVEAFPYHCDVLALSNVLALVFGRDGSSMGNMGPMGTAQAGMGNTDPLDMMIGIGGPPSLSAPGPSGVGGNGMLSVQDAMLLHQQFGGGVSGGGGPGGTDKLSLLQQQQGSQQDLTTGGLGAAGLGGTLGSGLGGGGGMGSGGLGGGGLGGLNSGGNNPAGVQRLNPFGAMAELQSMMGGGVGNNGAGGGLDGTALRGGDAGGAGGGMSAAAVKQELQSLQAAAMARQAAGQMLGPGVGGDMAAAKAAAGGGGLAVFNQQHHLSSNLSGLTQGGGLMDNGVGVGPSGVGPNAASNLSPDLMAGPGAGLGGPGPKGMPVGGGPGATLQGAGSLGVVGGLAGAGSLGGGGGLVGSGSLGGGGLGASGLGGGAGLFGKAGPQGGAPTLNLSMPGAGGGGLGLGGGGGLGALGGHADALGSLGQQNSGSLPISTVSRYGNGAARGGVLLDAGARGPAGPGGFSR
ncbi:hypothetical protein Vretimale_11674 [Volvox reticuliferus]|uniref:Uncharacterized protein n=1 Tax=Volvox reticuliferus TaxID=1737510 RepID=A0A8J4GIP8_9CHLO|nr:hypothetical protein Vretimale_11674 [Volvox reticuliferus]